MKRVLFSEERTAPFSHARRSAVDRMAASPGVRGRCGQAERAFPRRDGGIVGGQLRRAALSIPSNIAEGCGKGSRKETIRFLHMAGGSAAEAESHLLIAADMGFVTAEVREQFLGDAKTIQRMLAKLIANLP